MTVAGVPDRTLWQNTVGKDFSDPSFFTSPEVLHTADTNVLRLASGYESCLTSVIDSSTERNPLEPENFFKASNRHRGP